MSSSNNSETAPSTSGPKLCNKGCGFFGSEATGGCCSKCFVASLKKSTAAAAQTAPALVEETENATITCSTVDALQAEPAAPQATGESDEKAPSASSATPAATTAATTTKKKKKKKKASYKSLMANMMKETNKDADKEREALRDGLGGGNFSKVAKI